ncbi:hypothetical protein GF362_05985 [Candidatus Dojkabacteria bacterium]|nr:hypothetical protein [Candidatus Dojkabacteria bacterium]
MSKINKLYTEKHLQASNLLFQDAHIHLEGVLSSDINFIEVFKEAVEYSYQNDKFKNQFEKITKNKITDVVDRYIKSMKKNGEKKTLSFFNFLNRLFSSKIILASDYNIIRQYVKLVLGEYFKVFWKIRLGITPSIPLEFPHLKVENWNAAVFESVLSCIYEDEKRSACLVIETKRQHLSSKKNSKYYFEYNLKLLKDYHSSTNQRLRFSLSICDDASKYPLFNKNFSRNFEKYILKAKQFSNTNISIHMLESLPKIKFVDKNLKKKVSNNKTYELDFVLEILNKHKIFGVNYIHMSHLFSGINPNPKKRKKSDEVKIQKGINYLEKIKQRGDRIIVCLSSSAYLNNPFLLDYPEFIRFMIENDLCVTLGTDDPYPFKVRDIGEELNKVEKRIKEGYPNGIKIKDDKFIDSDHLSKIVKLLLGRNSWRLWDERARKWKFPDKDFIQRLELDCNVFQKTLCFDICPENEDLINGQIKEVFRRS